LARRLAAAADLALPEIVGTGPGGRVVRRDVEHAIAAKGSNGHAPSTAPAPAAAARAADATGSATYEDIPHTRMRRAIATRLSESKRDAPHFYLSGTARVDRLLRLRADLNASGALKVSVNDLVVLAAARAHAAVPAINVTWTPDATRQWSGVDIAIAVASERGLVTPVVRGVDRMTVSALASTTHDLVTRARAGRLREDELSGGTLTVTNLGPYGTESFSAILNPPQSAILAVGAAREEPLVRKGKVKVGTVMHLTLSVDHRAVDGAVAAQWMAALVDLLEHPVRVLA
jgi:pyruvate dehydrogenase E2 component (dihydrolipoamide acetyltransferase)